MARDIRVPKLGLNMKEGRLQSWEKQEGETVKKEEIVLIIESDKASYELPSPASGILHIIETAASTVPVGNLVGLLAESSEEYETIKDKGAGEFGKVKEAGKAATSEKIETPRVAEASQAPEKTQKRISAAPVAKALAKEHNIDLSTISGSGPGGRIMKKDVLDAISRKESAVAPTPAEVPGAIKEQIEGLTVKQRLPDNPMRKVMGEKMHASLQTTAQLSASGVIDMTEIILMRQKLLEEEHALGFRVSYTELFLKAVAYTLRAHPIMNSSMIDDEVIIWDDINIGIAADISLDEYSAGLVVPVVRKVDKKSLTEIHEESAELIKRVREHKFTADDFASHTFTVSNVGKFKVSSGTGTPILNQPDVGLLMTRPYEDKPVVVDGQVVIRPMMDYTLTYDHRVVTGGDAMRFRETFEKVIRNPYLLLR